MTKKNDWFNEKGYHQFEDWTAEGYPESSLAALANVHPETFRKWKRDNNLLADALARGKARLLEKTKKALLKRTLGYDATESKVTEVKDAAGEVQSTTTTTTTKHIPSDTTAIIFMMKNLDRYHPILNPEGFLSDPASQFNKEMKMLLDAESISMGNFAGVANALATASIYTESNPEKEAMETIEAILEVVHECMDSAQKRKLGKRMEELKKAREDERKLLKT